MYASVQAMKDRVPAKDLRELTDETGEVINDAVIATALADASNEIDSYLSGRYQLPLTDVPARLERDCITLALYYLYAGTPTTTPEDVRKRYEDVNGFLKMVSAGKVQLGVDAETGAPAEQTAGPEVITSTRRFDRDAMKGF